MSLIKKSHFPYRLPLSRLKEIYPSLEAAFASHDYVYVSRYGKDNPELHGCALIMLGNRVGGEAILNQNNIHTVNSYLYRAYAAWQYDEKTEAKQWISEAHKLGTTDPRFDRLERLIKRDSFRILFHTDFDGKTVTKMFTALADFDVIVTKHLQADGEGTLPIGQPLKSILPEGDEFDFVLLDDLKMVPVGIGDLGAPVVANVHDNEWYHDFLDLVMPEIDLLSPGSTSERVEIGHRFECPSTIYFYHLPFQMPNLQYSLAENFNNKSGRTIDLFYSSWQISHDCYRYKRQEILSLAKLDNDFSVDIGSRSYTHENYWQKLQSARFSLNLTRGANALPTRAIEALMCGTLHLVEEENGFPYLFSQNYSCFPKYNHETALTDINCHLHNYDTIFQAFQIQLSEFQAEFDALFPKDNKIRASRYLKHLLFITQVANERGSFKKRSKSKRDKVYVDQTDLLIPYPKQLERLLEQTKPPHWLRRAFIKGRIAQAQSKPKETSLLSIIGEIRLGRKELPNSMALFYTEGLCQRLLGFEEEAEKSFAAVTSEKLQLYSDDPPSMQLGRCNSFYWISDARIRADNPKELEQFVPPENIWISYAWANRADIVLNQALVFKNDDPVEFKKEKLNQAVTYSKNAIEKFSYNDAAQRVYLRALFALSEYDKKWADLFLEEYESACHNDGLFLSDFAVLAIHLLSQLDRRSEVDKIREDLERYYRRIELLDWEYIYYPEVIPLLKQYNLSKPNIKKT